MNKYIAEFIGTLALASMVGLSVAGSFVIATPILAALTLGLFVYTVGHISGTHLNPAVTLGQWSVKKITIADAVYFVGAQLIAGACAYALVRAVHPEFTGVGSITAMEFVGELVGTFFFTFGVASVVSGKTPTAFSGLIVGGSLLLGISFAALLGAAGALNPAVALMLGAFNPVYIIAPVIGAVLGFQAYKFLNEHS